MTLPPIRALFAGRVTYIVAYVIGNDSNMIVPKTEFEKFESSYQEYELHAIYSSDKQQTS